MFNLFRERLRESVAEPGQALGRWARFVGFQFALWRHCARRLREHDVFGMSAALCYRTIFTMVPILVLGLLVAKSLGTLENSKQSLRKFLQASGFGQIEAIQDQSDAGSAQAATETPPASTAPTTTASPKVVNLADEIEKIVDSVEGKLTFSRIGPIGGALLIWTAVGLLTALEHSLNRIFGAARSRSVARRLLLYWSALTLGPVTLALASYLGNWAIEIFQSAPGFPWLLVALGWAGPIVVGILLLATLYKLLPNTTVLWRSAIGGAAVASVIWLVAKWGFALYIERLVLKGNLYGVLGVLPLFLLWLYYSWLILLFGAELAHTAVNLEEMRREELAEHTILGPSDVLAAAIAVAQPFVAGKGPVSLDEIAGRLRLPSLNVQSLMDRLVASGFVCAADDPLATHYVPTRPPSLIPVNALLSLGDPRGAPAGEIGHEPELAKAVARVQTRVRAALGETNLGEALQ